MCLVCKKPTRDRTEFFSLERDGVVGPRSRAETRTPGAGDRDGGAGRAVPGCGGCAAVRSPLAGPHGHASLPPRARREPAPVPPSSPAAQHCRLLHASCTRVGTARASERILVTTAEAATTEERRDRYTISTIIRVVFDCGSSYRSVAWRRYSDRRLPGSGLPSGRSDAFGARRRSLHAVFVHHA